MPKQNNNRNRRNGGRRKRNTKSSRSTTRSNQPTHEIPRLPVLANQVVRIRRSLQRTFQLNPAVGIDGFAFFDMQMLFLSAGVNWRIGGVSVYTDTVPNVADFTNLFDQWRLRSVVVRVDTPAGYFNSGLSLVSNPLVLYAPDYDDSQQAVRADLLQYPQVKVHSFQKDGYTPLMFEFEPKPLREVAGSGVLSTYGPMNTAPWIRTVDSSTAHYGIKLFYDFMGYTVSVNQPLEFTVFLNIEFTNPK